MTYTMRKRKRTNHAILDQGVYGQYREYAANGDTISVTPYTAPPLTQRLMVEECEDVDRRIHKRGKTADDGGPFKLKKLTIDKQLVRATNKFSGLLATPGRFMEASYDGDLNIDRSNILSTYSLMSQATIDSQMSSFSFPTTDLNSYEPKARMKLDPTQYEVDLALSISEFAREGLPKMPQKLFSKVRNLRADGSDYLAVQFGWIPLLSDIKKMLQIYLTIEKRIAQLKRDNGQNVRRSGTLSHTKSTSSTEVTDYVQVSASGNPTPGTLVGFWPGYTPLVLDVVTEEKVWFSGKGSYILPSDLLRPDWDPSDKLRLLTGDITPSTVYNLLPWTWLIDWFSNLGDIIQNATAKGIGEYTMDYCYLMRHKSVTSTYSATTLSNRGFRDYYDSVPTVEAIPSSYGSVMIRKETKERLAATPFGFDLQLSDLSVRQYAILTALGLSRSNFSI